MAVTEENTQSDSSSGDAASVASSTGAANSTPPKNATAGQRLAAAKAAKAAKKAAERGKGAEQIEEKAEETVEAAASWLEDNGPKLAVAFLAVVVLGGAYVWWSRSQSEEAAVATSRLWEAVEMSTAPIRAEGQSGIDIEGQSFASIDARSKETLEQYGQVRKEYPKGPIAAWSALGEGNAHLQSGAYDKARTAYEDAVAKAHDYPFVTLRALEGQIFAYEAEKKWDEALRKASDLGSVTFGGAKEMADYHRGRIQLAKGEKTEAIASFKAALDSLRDQTAIEDGAPPPLTFLRNQVEQQLTELDPDAVNRMADVE